MDTSRINADAVRKIERAGGRSVLRRGNWYREEGKRYIETADNEHCSS